MRIVRKVDEIEDKFNGVSAEHARPANGKRSWWFSGFDLDFAEDIGIPYILEIPIMLV